MRLDGQRGDLADAPVEVEVVVDVVDGLRRRDQRGGVVLDLAAEPLGVAWPVVAAAHQDGERAGHEVRAFAAAPGAVWHGVAETDQHRRQPSISCGPPRDRPAAWRTDRLEHVLELVEVVPADHDRRRGAARRPCLRSSGRNCGLCRRGLTHTMRWARRASRSISRPNRAGSPPSQPSDTMTTTAPRASPRRAHPSLNALMASPRRVPPDQSGVAAIAAARATAGWVGAQLAGEAVQPRGEDERLGPQRPDRPVQQVQVGPAVGLHRPRHVGDQDHAPLAGTATAAHQPERVATRAGGQPATTGAGRSPHLGSARRCRRLRRCGGSRARSSISARSCSSSAGVHASNGVVRRRSSTLAAAVLGTSVVIRGRAAGRPGGWHSDGTKHSDRRGRARGGGGRPAADRRDVRVAGDARDVDGAAKDLIEDAVERLDLRRVRTASSRGRTSTARRRGPGRAAARAAAKRPLVPDDDRHAGGVQEVPEPAGNLGQVDGSARRQPTHHPRHAPRGGRRRGPRGT